MENKTYTNKSLTIGTTASVILPDRTALKQKRTSFIITNISTGGQTIYLSVAEEATAEAGITLAVGGHYEITINNNYLPPQRQITAISSAIGGKLSIYEEAFNYEL